MITDRTLTAQLVEFKTKKRYTVQLFKDRLELYSLSLKTTQTIFTKEISGVAQSCPNYNQISNSAFLSIYTYKLSKNQKRIRDEIVLEFDSLLRHEDNLNQAQNWCKEITILLSKIWTVKPLLVFVNPKSGAGKAQNIFHERALTILSEANVPYVLVLTGKRHSHNELFFIRILDVVDDV